MSVASPRGYDTRMRPIVDELTAEIRAFRDGRDWWQFHNPKELAVAITAVAFPEGGISFVHAIPPIGTKFHAASA